MNKQDFIVLYLDDYVRMAYRELVNKIDINNEIKLIHNLQGLLDEYSEGELNKYINNNKIV